MNDDSGWTELMYACVNNHDLAELLVKHSIFDINYQLRNNGDTAFHIACRARAFECVNIFLNNEDVDYSLQDINGSTAFDNYFCSVSTDKYGSNGIYDLEYDILKLFEKHYKPITNVNDCRKFNIFHAHGYYRFESYHVFDFFLENWKPTKMLNQQDEYGNTPLHYACNGIVLKKNDNNARRFATLIKQPDILVTIPNDKGRTLFHCACFRLRTDIKTHLIDYSEIDLKAIDYTGECALHHIIQGLIRYPIQHNCQQFITILNLILNKLPHLVNLVNNSYESVYDYACLCQRAMESNQNLVVLNGKKRKFEKKYIIDGEVFWNNIINTMRGNRDVLIE